MKLKEFGPQGGVRPCRSLPYSRGSPWQRPPVQRLPLWTKNPWDPSWTETHPLDRDSPGEKPPGQKSPSGQRPPGQRPTLDRDPPDGHPPRQRHPSGQSLGQDRDPLDRAPHPSMNRMTHRCKNITFPQLRLLAVKSSVFQVFWVFGCLIWRWIA